MKNRLIASGIRPINNIVDITNYVLVEYGHPMHAFDLACVEDGHIIVRNAYEGEHVTTLDGIRIDYDDGWVLIRASGTEPKFRIYSESSDEGLTKERSEHYRGLVEKFIEG